VLAGERSQLESWVRESFAAMDSLHDELAQWQRDLARQQAELDQREAALADGVPAGESAAIARVEQKLTDELRELRKLIERQGSLLDRLSANRAT
jgi:hypothetical protein